ncbi:MAG: PKD domain-containing protein, partial [Bacteroidetes bacterium]|nr:PKD domain-containing protein [Bacteroidota bacterium]
MKTKAALFRFLQITALTSFLLHSIVINNTKAQVTADFSAGNSSGCSPLLVQFINTSEGTGNLSYHWNFGNGNSSELKDPLATYIAPGSYIVTLTVTSGQVSAEKTGIITVFRNPGPVFSVSEPDGCVPHEAAFTAAITNSTTVIAQWLWDFGDGNTGNQPQPGHTYTLAGDFPVSLEVTDVNGCKGSLTAPGYIHSFALPVAAFYADNGTVCNSAGTVQFLNLSSGAGELQAVWNLGDGIITDELSPIHTYSGPGNYDVSLTITDANGCSATTTENDEINILGNIASFGLERDTVCAGVTLDITLFSVPADQYIWNFGDSAVSQDAVPVHSYQFPGVYTISLTASIENGCSATSQKNVFVEQITADFITYKDFSCELPADVQFADQSVNAVSWEWLMGNGNIYTNQHPLNAYNHTDYNPALPANYYSDTLIVTSVHGCIDTMIAENNMKIVIPEAYFTPHEPPVGYNPLISGCVPLTVFFNDGSQYETNNDEISSWHWDFGDGSTSGLHNPGNTFNNPGEFETVLTITTTLGCTSQFSTTIMTGTPQQAGMSLLSNDTVCASETVGFEDLSTDQDVINGWFWSFSDGSISFEQNPGIAFTDTGYMDASLTVYYNNCPSEPVGLEDIVYINAPLASFLFWSNCPDPYTYLFNSNFIDVHRYYWNFDDSTPIDSVNENPVHTFSEKGDYNV